MDIPAPQPEGEFEDDKPFGPPVPADDRLWRHPSEMKGISLNHSDGRSSSTARPHGNSRLAVFGLGAVLVASVAVMVGSLFIAGPGNNSPPGGIATTASKLPSSTRVPVDSALIANVLGSTRQSLVGISAMSQDGHSIEGSGVVVSSNGLVLTSASLVRGHHNVAVEMQDGRVIEGVVEGIDPDAGLALVNTPLSNVPPLKLATSAVPISGEMVFAIGAPGPNGGPPQVAVGSVETVAQPVALKNMTILGAMKIDVPLSGRAIGGILVDMYGHVIGINLAASSAGKGTLDIAAPASLAQWDIQQLSQFQSVSHGWLGIMSDQSNTMANEPSGGVEVASVIPSGPAARAGIVPGDVIKAVNSLATPTMAALQQEIRLRSPGAIVTVTVVRGKQILNLKVALSSDDA